MKKRFFALFLTMALLLPAVLLSGCASADSGIMDTANLNATAWRRQQPACRDLEDGFRLGRW
ncbi:MAG: hypothetical protein ACLTYN_00500 [Dysosmobacter welbionis]